MLTNPAAFFDIVRKEIFGGSMAQSQVTGINAILDAWDLYGDGNLQRLAYVLATPNVETGGAYQPIYERGPKSYFAKYEPGTAIGKKLGNVVPGEGYTRRGRGLVQQTGRSNDNRIGKIIGVDFIGHPELALDLKIAARVLVEGVMKGWFTGKGLADYIDDADEFDDLDLAEFKSARRTVNGVDKASVIAQDALDFERALKSGGYKRGIAPVPIGTAAPKGPPTRNTWLAILSVLGGVIISILKGMGFLG